MSDGLLTAVIGLPPCAALAMSGSTGVTFVEQLEASRTAGWGVGDRHRLFCAPFAAASGCHRLTGVELHLSAAGFAQSSVRKGTAGRRSLLYRLTSGLFAQAYRTATGAGTAGLLTTTASLPSIVAVAQTKW